MTERLHTIIEELSAYARELTWAKEEAEKRLFRCESYSKLNVERLEEIAANTRLNGDEPSVSYFNAGVTALFDELEKEIENDN
jgi:hypothetical protein